MFKWTELLFWVQLSPFQNLKNLIESPKNIQQKQRLNLEPMTISPQIASLSLSGFEGWKDAPVQCVAGELKWNNVEAVADSFWLIIASISSMFWFLKKEYKQIVNSNHHFPTILGDQVWFHHRFQMVQSGCVSKLSETFLTFRCAEESRCKCLKLSFFWSENGSRGCWFADVGKGLVYAHACGFSLLHVVVFFLRNFGFKLFIGGGWGNVAFNEKGLLNYKNTSF